MQLARVSQNTPADVAVFFAALRLPSRSDMALPGSLDLLSPPVLASIALCVAVLLLPLMGLRLPFTAPRWSCSGKVSSE